MSLGVEATGSPGAPAIVFLHGVAASSWMWWRQVPAFADHLCLAVDLPGHGRSRDVPWVSLADAAGQVAALVRARTATGRAHVVGLSLGGHVALTLLEHHPDVVDRAVVSGVTAEPWPHRWLLGPQVWLTTRQLRNRRLVEAQARSLGLPPEVQGAFTDTVLAMDPRTYRRITTEVAGYGLPRSLRTVRTPTLVLAGGRESAAIRRAVQLIPAVVPGATGRVVPGVGHGWNVEAPELFTATVRAWIEGFPPAPG
ncbi:alpha/beta fold hydrolase [Geodermatophilus sabuli]|uniref:Pimeloyl-ACP methyl ester carboxylesterase n=1 Tax=Geodermatophilus sabuli TaxID=1564158 RepID=A0A285E9P2_9ACTN|nr:alpha/beta fold hydrolase [Geodermatophilus sabuli]MBB3082324.1 pimeloyl-ACP methyl ester carboxylesterase [Geodermatophilus sabuli]SNX94806.1 Pimeloyl-ACP methyl ester carboxylesterase [Geodermatophilus sabuli]